MPRPRRIFTNLYPYHVVTHLVDELKFSSSELDLCLKMLRKIRARFNVKIISYNFMHTHYHMIIQTNEQDLNIAMQYFNTNVSKKYNWMNNRKGAVWRHRYYAGLVESDAQLLMCMRYVDRNPMEANLVEDPFDWQWGSLKEYVDTGADNIISFPDIYNALGKTPEKRLTTYTQLVMTPIPADSIPKEWR